MRLVLAVSPGPRRTEHPPGHVTDHTAQADAPMNTPSPVNDGQWHTATLVGAGLFSTNPWHNAPGNTSTLRWSYFTGDIAQVKFHNTAPSAAQTGASATEADFAADGTQYPSGSTWYSTKSTTTFTR
jgi:hypothetical protein